MTSTRGKQLLGGAVLALFLATPASAALSDDAFESQLDRVIRSACHGYMVDALPDFLSGMRDWLNENSPFCQTVRTLPPSESAYALLERQKPELDYSQDPQYRISALSGHNDALYRNSDCNDWMCSHIRDRLANQGNPISLADYTRVEQHCSGRYECIESWFKTWPRPLPEPASPAPSGLTLDTLLTPSIPGTAPPATAPAANPATGLTLDAMMGTPGTAQPAAQTLATALPTANTTTSNAKSPDLSLDHVFAGREQLALERATASISRYNARLEDNCECSVANSGCYELPSQSLLERAGAVEQERLAYCRQWQQLQTFTPTSSEQASKTLGFLGKLEQGITALDRQIDELVDDWETEQQRRIAQQQREQREREDSAYLAAMVSIVAQSALTGGALDPQQGAQNAMNVYNGVASGESWGSALTNSLTSAIPNYANSSGGGGSAGYPVAGAQSLPDFFNEINAMREQSNAAKTTDGSTGIAATQPNIAGGTSFPTTTSGLQAGANSSSNSSGNSGMIHEKYSYTCASGTSYNIDIYAYTQACAQAQKRYSRFYSCNFTEEDLDNIDQVEMEYRTACAKEMAR